MRKINLIIIIIILLLSACRQNSETTDKPQDVQLLDTEQPEDLAWTNISSGGLPANIKVQDMTVFNSRLYLSLTKRDNYQSKEAGIWHYDGESWIQDFKGSFGKIHFDPRGRLLVSRSDYLENIESSQTQAIAYFDDSTQSFLNLFDSEGRSAEDFDIKGDFLLTSCIENNRGKFFLYQFSTGIVKDLDSPLEDLSKTTAYTSPDGKIFVASKFNGVYKHTGQDWVQIEEVSNSRQGKESGMANDGTFFISFEEQPATQLSSIFLYDGSDNLDGFSLIAQCRGYGTKAYPFGPSAAYFDGMGSQFIIDVNTQRQYNLPSVNADLERKGVDLKDANSLNTICTDNSIYFIQSYELDGQTYLRVLKYTADLDTLPYQSNNTPLLFGGLLGEDNTNEAVAVKIFSDGSIAAARNVYDQNLFPAAREVAPEDPASGKLEWISADGSLIQHSMTFSQEKILDLDINHQDRMALATSKRALLLDKEGNILWEYEYPSSKKRIAINPGNDVAVLLDNEELRLIGPDASGKLTDESSSFTLSRTFSRNYTEDVEITTDRFYTVGYDNKNLPGGGPVQVAYLNCFDFSGNFLWQKFGFSGADLGSNVADTRLYRINIGQDRKLYILGETAGSESIYRYNGDVYEGEVILSIIDFYNELFNTGPAHIAYYACLDPQNGEILASQITMARLPDGYSNTIRVSCIDADSQGRVYVGGFAGAYISARASQKINGQAVDEYQGSDPMFLALAPGFNARYYWTSFSRDAGKGRIKGLCAGLNKVFCLSTVNEDGEMFTTNNQNNEYSSNVHLGIINMER